jgi:hypothetical protein
MRYFALILALSLTACAGSLPTAQDAADHVSDKAKHTLGAVQAVCSVFPLVDQNVDVPPPVRDVMARCKDVQSELQMVIDTADSKHTRALLIEMGLVMEHASALIRDIEAMRR